MQVISEVEKAISLNQELLTETKKRITETSVRLNKAQGSVKKNESEIADAKEKRQSALARGGDAKSLNDSLKKLEGELELETETVEGLQKFLNELRAEEQALTLKLSDLPKRILQLQSLELAAEYNSLAEQLAPVVEALNGIYYKLGGNGNHKESLVAFYPMAGPFVEIPKIFCDDAGLTLEAFVAKNPGLYHTNTTLPASERNFYNWTDHERQLNQS